MYLDHATKATYAVKKCLLLCGSIHPYIALQQFPSYTLGGCGMEGGSQSYLRLFVSYS